MVAELNKHIPAYRQIEDQIREMIRLRELKPFDQLWSEREICEQFEVSRMTARKAIGNLIKEGYLFTQSGKGTFVSDNKIDQPVLKLRNFFDEMEDLGLEPGARIISWEEMRAGRRLADHLDVDPESNIFRVRRIMTANSVPYTIESKWIVPNFCSLLQHWSGEDREILDLLSGKCHKCVTRFDIFIEATALNEEEMKLLNLERQIPAFCLKRYAYDSKQRKISLTKSIYRGDLYRFQGRAEY